MIKIKIQGRDLAINISRSRLVVVSLKGCVDASATMSGEGGDIFTSIGNE